MWGEICVCDAESKRRGGKMSGEGPTFQFPRDQRKQKLRGQSVP